VEHPAVDRVRAALRTAGASQAAAGVRWLDGSARTAREAADAVGVQVGPIANSLVFDAGGVPLLVLASGGRPVDPVVVAPLVGAIAVRRASPEYVREHAGVAIGGVAPVGHPAPLRTLVDRELAAYDVVWAAAGHPHAVFPTSYDELVRVTGGTPATVR
jgi:prolyl-tRNA editing enzyme YbaK/EbsC (Cys-tRNA(Pro) deacylase)